MVSRGGVTAVVLAGGEGTRMQSELPKVLHKAAGRPLLGHVLAALEPLGLERRIVVVSGRGDEIKAALAASGFSDGLSFVVQSRARGTGDAARVAFEALDPGTETVLVVHGDTPLLQTQTLEALLATHSHSSSPATLLTAEVDDPSGLGRVVRDGAEIAAIVEERDATIEQRLIREVNASVYALQVATIAPLLSKLDSENARGEYYLTDIVALLRAEGKRVTTVTSAAHEAWGVNSRSQLAHAAEILRRKACDKWLDRGVTIVDPATTYIDPSVSIGPDATILPFTFLEGETQVGARAEVGPQTRIVDSDIGEGATVSFAVVRDSVVGPHASVGPFASLRPGSRLERGSKVGTFVETKETVLGEGSKANHLAYLGDAQIGRNVNVGAGTITCNWDGQKKHRSVLDDDVYIGSDTMLVAPVHVGKRGATGAGAVVRGEVPADALAVGVPARVILGKGDKMRTKSNPGTPDAERGE